jgi:hypothetical protein
MAKFMVFKSAMHNFQMYIKNINVKRNYALGKKWDPISFFAELAVANTLPSVLVYVVYRAETARLDGTCRQK